MDWMEVIAALALVMFIVMIFPAAGQMAKNNLPNTQSDWKSFIMLIAIIVLFVVFLMQVV